MKNLNLYSPQKHLRSMVGFNLSFVLLFVFLTGLSGCLKTRAQLKSENLNDTPTPIATYSTSSTPDTTDPVPTANSPAQGNQYETEEMKAEILKLNTKIDELEQQLKAQKAAPTPEPTPTKTTSAVMINNENDNTGETTAEENQKPKKITLETAQKLYRQKKYTETVEAMDSYIKTEKKNLDHAYYLRAESNYGLKQYKKAILDYSVIREKYTQSVYLKDSLYKIGLCFDAIGLKEDAKIFYQELAEKFPKSLEAKKTKKLWQ